MWPNRIKSTLYEMRRLRLIADHVVGDNILDVGYASLPNPYLKNCHRTGYDIIEKPEGAFSYEEHIRGDVYDIKEKLKGRKFSTIICGELIEHLENPYLLLRELRPLLNFDGRLIISRPILLVSRFFWLNFSD